MDLNDDTFDSFVNNNNVCVVDFWAPWCGPCKMLAPVIQEACDEAEVPLGKVNVDIAKNNSVKFGVMSIPCIVLFNSGEEVGRIVGNVPKKSILSAIEKTKNEKGIGTY